MDHGVGIALVSCPPEGAADLARALVEARVAACVNVLPGVHSVYRWQGELQQDTESLLVIKFPADGFDALKQAVLARHPYELPEVIAVHVAGGHQPYLAWVLESCR